MKAFVLPLIALAGLTFPASANLLQNGSFENGNFINGNYGFQDRMYLGSGSTDITSWTIGHDGGWAFVWWLTKPGFNAFEGNLALSLDGNNPEYAAWAEQSFPTEVGKKYRVSFAYSSDANGGPSQTQILIDGNLIGEVEHGSGTGGSEPLYDYLDWDQAAFEFIATASSSLLRIYDATQGNYNTIVDDVSVTEVVVAPIPESSTLLAGIGLCGGLVLTFRASRGRQGA
jgi:hypothetical protein